MADRHWSKIYLVGLGGVGAVYLSRLQTIASGSVRVIVDEQRKAALIANPTSVNGQALTFDTLVPGQRAEPASLLLIAVKARQLEQALHDALPFTDRNTVVLPLLNGVAGYRLLNEAFDPRQVLAAAVYTHATRNGRSVTSRYPGKLVFGEQTAGPPSVRVLSLRDLLERAGIATETPSDMQHALWSKFMLNVAANQVSCVLRATYGQMRASQNARALLLDAAMEVVSLANRVGIAMGEEDLSRMMQFVDSMPAEAKTSMLQDIEAGRVTEVDVFAGEVVAHGQQLGIPVPLNALLLRLIRAAEETRSASLANEPL